MRKFFTVALIAALPSITWADEVGFFGPEGDVMTELLLRQALNIAEMDEQEFRGRTKSVGQGGEGFDEFDLLRVMYQRDPDATLSFIDTLRKAREAE